MNNKEENFLRLLSRFRPRIRPQDWSFSLFTYDGFYAQNASYEGLKVLSSEMDPAEIRLIR